MSREHDRVDSQLNSNSTNSIFRFAMASFAPSSHYLIIQVLGSNSKVGNTVFAATARTFCRVLPMMLRSEENNNEQITVVVQKYQIDHEKN